jgi:S-adenosylmethionine:diacylglycerol 3-amino-3-carboxypropyl transferase
MKEIQSIIENICSEQPQYAQPLERLRIISMDKIAEALADGYLSGVHDIILMLQDYMKDKDGKSLRDQLKEQALNAAQANFKIQRSNDNTGQSK